MSLPDYAELHCLSNFSFLRGASHPEELVERAVAQGYAALALTDECSLAGVVRAHLAARKAGLKFIVGSEMTMADGLKLVFLACNRHGYGNLSALATLARRRAAKGAYTLQRNDLEALSPSGAVPDCLVLWLPPGEAASAGDRKTGAGWPRASPAAAGWPSSCMPDRTIPPGWKPSRRWARQAVCLWSRPATCICTSGPAARCRMC